MQTKIGTFSAIITAVLFKFGSAIDCFKCVSINSDYKPCEDPFHNNYTTDVFESPCMGGRKGRDGLFPATSCVKITGVFEDNGDTITLRGCALDSGTLTTDTEIVRMSHCGGFHYDNRYAKGCVQSCNDADACNSVSTLKTNVIFTFSMSFVNYYVYIMLYRDLYRKIIH